MVLFLLVFLLSLSVLREAPLSLSLHYVKMSDIDKHSSDVHETGSSDDVARPAIWDDPEMEGLTLYEKKALLVNRELDSHGMAKYQWWIWGLCGFGYFIDLMWAQAFGLVVKPMQIELGFPGV